jgi:hypothetical protein
MAAITDQEIEKIREQFPLNPKTVSIEHREHWLRWRAICDRITSNPHYRYEDPKKFLLLNLARFAGEMMGVHNCLAYGGGVKYYGTPKIKR